MAHVVTRPVAPFLSASGALEVHQIPSWQDNLVWLLRCTKSGQAALLDGPGAEEALAYCSARDIEPTHVFNTHVHPDHVGLNRDLQSRGLLANLTVVGARRTANAVPGISQPVCDGDRITLGESSGEVWLTEGHINGHICFLFEDLLFCGDTLFAGGCGYLCDGPPGAMHESLTRLAALPEQTKVCCAHEYTQDNLRFAWSVEPGNEELRRRIARVWQLRAGGGCAVPSTIAEERATNPFMRWHSEELRLHVEEALPEMPSDTPEQIFAATRRLKDLKRYRDISDGDLPVTTS